MFLNAQAAIRICAAEVNRNAVRGQTLIRINRETPMAYAVFENEERLTRIFATEQQAWDAAERAGLIDVAPDGTKILDDHLEIRFCAGEPEAGEDAGADFKIY